MPPTSQHVFEYQTADITTIGDYTYFGETNHIGNWIITRQGNLDGSYRYAKGLMDYATNYANRASLTYDYFHNIF